MHNYNTLRAIHDDRMREMTQKADAYRMATAAKKRQARPDPGPRVRRWMSFGSIRQWVGARRSAHPSPSVQR